MIIFDVLKHQPLDYKNLKIEINPSGSFTIWGSFSDSGAVGRKQAVDTYGGVGRHGGGALSSKDPTKVDRSGAYFARYVAKNIVAAGLADKCEVAVSYAIGRSEPTSISVDTYGTGMACDDCILKLILKLFDFRPSAIIETLNLKRPIYSETAVGGHFGKVNMPWEKTDMVGTILEEASKW